MNKIKTQYNIDEFIFYLGIFFIPFDNLFFAPSFGWATIAPIILFCYVLLNLRYVSLNYKTAIVILVIVIFSLLNYGSFTPTIEGIIDCLSAICLGTTFYLSINIFFIRKKNSPKKFLRILFVAYCIAFCYGLISLLNISIFESFRMFFEKRYYPGRLQYTFTEPSFISMHLYGVILPCIIIFKKNSREIRKLKILLVCYILVTLLFGSSARFYLDTIVVLIFLFIKWYLGIKKFSKKIVCIGVSAIVLFIGVIAISRLDRFQSILTLGIYADASLASRFFRINAIIKGLLKDPLHALFGFGVGNTSYPFNMGYEDAVVEYQNAYLGEVLGLKDTTTTSFFCGHLRIIADMGIVFYIPLILLLWKKSKGNRLLFFIVLYLYIQFDSYAFYTVWLLLFYGRLEKNKMNQQRVAYNTKALSTTVRNYVIA